MNLMSRNAYLPCFVCGTTLENVSEDVDNQPYRGTEFRTEGHYGSTFWDPFDGEELILNVCDDCLRTRTDRLGQQKSHLPVFCEGAMVGRQRVERPLVAYTGNADTTSATVEPEELGTDLRGVEWSPAVAETRQ
jgi:hypothetical protein